MIASLHVCDCLAKSVTMISIAASRSVTRPRSPVDRTSTTKSSPCTSTATRMHHSSHLCKFETFSKKCMASQILKWPGQNLRYGTGGLSWGTIPGNTMSTSESFDFSIFVAISPEMIFFDLLRTSAGRTTGYILKSRRSCSLAYLLLWILPESALCCFPGLRFRPGLSLASVEGQKAISEKKQALPTDHTSWQVCSPQNLQIVPRLLSGSCPKMGCLVIPVGGVLCVQEPRLPCNQNEFCIATSAE